MSEKKLIDYKIISITKATITMLPSNEEIELSSNLFKSFNANQVETEQSFNSWMGKCIIDSAKNLPV